MGVPNYRQILEVNDTCKISMTCNRKRPVDNFAILEHAMPKGKDVSLRNDRVADKLTGAFQHYCLKKHKVLIASMEFMEVTSRAGDVMIIINAVELLREHNVGQ